jgi:2-amino-4-hydroxy-6-hydroxymethyldihydropteridine diphosphokinase
MRDGRSDEEKGLAPSDVYMLFGSNVGDRYGNIDRGLRALGRRGIQWEAFSSYYETEPTDVEDQPWFVNLVAEGRTDLDPAQLLALCKEIEHEAGRNLDAPRYSPRVLDIDILLFGSLRLNSPSLVIPHPRMVERRFVLVPLIEIAPDIADPRDGRLYREILEGLDEVKKVTKSKTREFLSQ